MKVLERTWKYFVKSNKWCQRKQTTLRSTAAYFLQSTCLTFIFSLSQQPASNYTDAHYKSSWEPFLHKKKFISSRGLQSFVLKPFNLSIYHSSLHHIWQMPSSNLTKNTVVHLKFHFQQRIKRFFSYTFHSQDLDPTSNSPYCLPKRWVSANSISCF